VTVSANRLLGLSLGVVVFLQGCASDDPRQGGLLGGLIGLGSGTYDRRVDDRRAALRADEQRLQQEAEDGQQLEQALEESEAEAAELEQQVALLRQDIDGLDAEIAALERDESLTRDDVEEAEAGVATLLDEIDRIEAEQAVHDQARALGADAGEDRDPAEFGEPSREQVSDLRAYINKLEAAVDALKAARLQQGAGEVAAPGQETN